MSHDIFFIIFIVYFLLFGVSYQIILKKNPQEIERSGGKKIMFGAISTLSFLLYFMFLNFLFEKKEMYINKEKFVFSLFFLASWTMFSYALILVMH